MNAPKFPLFTIVLMILTFYLIVPVAYTETSENEAASILTNAEDAAASAFMAILEAERSGANVSELLARLNYAAKDLDGAEIAFGLGDFELGVSLSSICFERSLAVRADADELRLEAYALGYRDAWLKMTESILGVLFVGVGGFWSWRIFKRRYYRRALEMKPEVGTSES